MRTYVLVEVPSRVLLLVASSVCGATVVQAESFLPAHLLSAETHSLALRGTARYTAIGSSVVQQWDSLCQGEACEIYTLGTGHCVFRAQNIVALDAPREIGQGDHGETSEVLQSYNCRVKDAEERGRRQSGQSPVPVQLFHCPKAVPIALLLIPKCGTTSGVNWAMSMEGERARASIARATRRLFREGKHGFMDWLGEELHVAFAANGLSFEGPGANVTASLADKLFERSLYRVSFGDEGSGDGKYVQHYVPPAHLCPMCCMYGHGRQRVVLARNPYLRLVSYYRFRWLNAGDVSQPRTRWVDFGAWLGSLLGFRAGRAGSFANDLGWAPQWLDGGLCSSELDDEALLCREALLLGLDDSDVFHLRPLGDMAADRRMLGGLGSFEGVHVVHLETLDADVVALDARLCEDFAYCEPLPPFPRRVLPSGDVLPERSQRERCELDVASLQWQNCTAPPWQELWTPHLVTMVQNAYREDFELLGYSTSPLHLRPLVVTPP